MSTSNTSIPTLDDYAFDLRKGLRAAAKASLASLEEMITEVGYGWLDGYMDGVMDKASRAPFAELIKTPSRTQTAKKTRATTVAARDRAQKVIGINAKLGLSPFNSKNSTTVRSQLSPLQPRSLNGPLSSSSLNVPPSPSPTKPGKAVPLIKSKDELKATKAEKAKAKTKGKKTKAKPIDENAENINVDESDSVIVAQSPEAFQQVKSPSQSQRTTRSISKSPVKQGQSSTASQAVPSIGSIADHIFTTSSKSKQIPTLAEAISPSRSDSAQKVNQPIVNTTMPVRPDLSMINEDEESRTSARNKSPITQATTTVQSPVKVVETQVDEVIPPTETVQVSERPAPPKPVSPIKQTIQPTLEPIVIPVVPAVPVRQVRSSWLRQALGTGTVPITGLPMTSTTDQSALRKSYAAPAQRPSTHVDLNGIRKSLVPLDGLKRKSDEGLDDEEEAEHKRPEKLAKVDIFSGPSKSTIEGPSVPLSTVMPIQTTLPLGVNAPAPATTATTTDVPSVEDHVSNPQAHGDRNRSDIHKVTKALDEMRERALAKQKAAALAASTGAKVSIATNSNTPTVVPTSNATGSGFLRGLGSLGRSLGMGGGTSAKSAEEEALRLQKEMEEDRRAEKEAEEELKKLMEGMAEEETKRNEDIEEEKQKTIASTVNDKISDPVSKTPVVAEMKADDEEVDELDEEDQVLEVVKLAEPVFTTGQMFSPPPSSQARPQVVEPIEYPESTTPSGTPPRVLPVAVEAPALHARIEKHVQPSPNKVKPRPKESDQPVPLMSTQEARVVENKPKFIPLPSEQKDMRGDRKSQAIEVDDHDDGKDDEEDEITEMPKKIRESGFVPNKDSNRSSVASLAASHMLAASTSSQATSSGMLNQASLIAAKSMGIKPAPGHVKALAMAAAAREKEQAANDRKAYLKDQADQRKLVAAKKKAEEDRMKMEEERRIRALELEEKKKLKLELEKRRKEREEKAAIMAKEKAAREEKENAAAAKIKADEEANRKRKMAPMLNKSSSLNPAKRVAGPTLSGLASSVKGKDQRLGNTLSSSTTMTNLHQAAQKVGPTSFRTGNPTGMTNSTSQLIDHHHPLTTSTSTITLVGTNTVNNGQAERRPLGPPSRPSAMQSHSVVGPGPSRASTVLQQSRVTLQSQLEQKAVDMQSEDIVLPDIASEYSDSDDEDKEETFARPQWADSPELRRALEQQSTFNPDELFGPIKPLSMEELFKVRTGKFRNRTSSANWSGGDRLTVQEEVEYARKMGFKSGLK